MTNVLSYLEKSAQCFPDKIAFADANSEISFSQLKDRAMSVATNLIKYVTPRKPVVLLMEKSTLTMTGFMGAVYAGCFYVLIDPRHPVQRIQTIINTLDAKVLLVDSARQKQAEKLGFEGDVLLLEDLQDTPADLEALDKIHALGCKAGIVLKPKTPAEAAIPYLEKCDMILVMTVEPGFGGQKFMEDMMPKVSQLKEWMEDINPECLIEVDGGVDANTHTTCKEAGANVLVAGSAYFNAADKPAFVKLIQS